MQHPWLDQLKRDQKAKHWPRKQAQQDKELLLREAGAINSTVNWDWERTGLTITVTAPVGFVWVSTQEKQLIQSTEKSDPAWVRESVSELLQHMQHGFNPAPDHPAHEECCECDACEEHQEDLDELDF